MRTYLSVVIVCMGVFLWCLGSAGAEQADWKILQESKYGDTWSYDAASVKKTGDNTILVWTKTQSSGYLYEIDCKNRKARLLEGPGADKAVWFNIVGADELLYKEVCP